MNIHQRKIVKGIVDVALIFGLAGSIVSTVVFKKSIAAINNSGVRIEDLFSWVNLHSIVSVLFISLVLVHIWMHRPFFQMLVSKGHYSKNLLTTSLLVAFTLIIFSVLFFIGGFSFFTLHIHAFFAIVFVTVALTHLVMKFRQLIKCFS